MAIDDIWTISIAGGAAVSFGSLDLGGVKFTRASQAADRLTMTQAAPYDADPVAGYLDRVDVFRDGALWFQGLCTGIAREGSGRAERIRYQVSGPWWQLQQVIYRQSYSRIVGGSAANPLLARLVLGTDAAGNRRHSGNVIGDVLAYADTELGNDALFQAGTIDVASQMPFEELNAMSVADIIKRVLRWNPDTITWVDYSTSPPTIHVRRRANLPQKTYAIADVEITDNSINPRHDLVREGVVVQYERTDTVDGAEQKSVIIDTAGDTSDPMRTLYLFFDLQGSSINYIRQKVSTKSIQSGSATWWKKRHPKLEDATGVSIANDSKTAVNDGAQNDGTPYAKELLDGSIAEWMGGVGTNTQIVKADVTYTPSAGGSSRTETLRLSLVGTNANDAIYSTVGSSSPAEPTPSGLAAAILGSLDTLGWEGTLRLVQADAGEVPHIDNRLNIAGGREEWESMDAQVASVALDLDAGTTQIEFGPPKHLAAGDLFQMLRNVRSRRGSSGALRAQIGGTSDLPTRSANTFAADDTGASADGFQLYFSSGTTTFLSMSDVLASYDPATDDHWSIVLEVSNGSFTGSNTVYGPQQSRYDDTGDDQTYWAIPVVRDGKRVSLGGVYREDRFCASSEGVLAMIGS